MIGIGPGVGVSRPRGLDRAIMALFAAGEKGVFYDFSDFSTMFQDSAGTTPVTAVEQPVGKILDKSGNGNHATQATSTARPVLRARYNLLKYSEAFDNAAWTKQAGTVVTANQATAPDGTLTADKVVGNGANGVHAAGIAVSTTSQNTKSVYIKGISGGEVVLLKDTSQTIGTTVCNLTTEWQRFTLSEVQTAGGAGLWIDDIPAGGIYIWGAQLNYGPTATSYQRIAAATDYDTVGFLQAADLDGVDDFSTQSAGGGSTTGFFLCAGIKPEGGAGAVRVLWSDAGTNTGYIVRLNASNQLELAAGNATAYTTIATVAKLYVGTAYVVTVWDDGTNLNVQVNNNAVASAARPVVAAGTATASIGSDNGAATGWFNGLIYSLIQVKNDAGTDAERASAKSYVASKSGVTL